MESIQTVRYTVEAKDTYTRGHSDRVSEYSVLIGQKLGLSEDDIRRLRIGGLFHDVGKIVLHTTNPKMYDRVISAVNDGNDVLDVERKYFDSDHVKTGSLLAKRWQLPILLANIVSYHHAPSLSSIPVPCNLVCVVDKLMQDRFDPGALDKDFLKTMGIDMEDVEDLRNAIMQKSELLIAELT